MSEPQRPRDDVPDLVWYQLLLAAAAAHFDRRVEEAASLSLASIAELEAQLHRMRDATAREQG